MNFWRYSASPFRCRFITLQEICIIFVAHLMTTGKFHQGHRHTLSLRVLAVECKQSKIIFRPSPPTHIVLLGTSLESCLGPAILVVPLYYAALQYRHTCFFVFISPQWTGYNITALKACKMPDFAVRPIQRFSQGQLRTSLR